MPIVSQTSVENVGTQFKNRSLNPEPRSLVQDIFQYSYLLEGFNRSYYEKTG